MFFASDSNFGNKLGFTCGRITTLTRICWPARSVIFMPSPFSRWKSTRKYTAQTDHMFASCARRLVVFFLDRALEAFTRWTGVLQVACVWFLSQKLHLGCALEKCALFLAGLQTGVAAEKPSHERAQEGNKARWTFCPFLPCLQTGICNREVFTQSLASELFSDFNADLRKFVNLLWNFLVTRQLLFSVNFQQVHATVKPFQCPYCPHTTARKAMIELHIRTHTGEKPYK